MPYYSHNGITLYNGDCLEVMAELAENSVDAVVTDPPYGIRELWVSVMTQAIKDYCMKVDCLDQRNAKRFLNGQGNFNLTCQCIGLNPTVAMRKVKQLKREIRRNER